MRLLGPLRQRPFRLLWTGMAVSLVGDGVLLVALAWQVCTLSGVPAAMSAVGVALTAPQVATLLMGGVVSDRFEARRVMAASDLVRGGCLALLAVLGISGHLRLWHLLALAAIYGAASGFFGPAFDVLVPRLTPAADLVQANALDQFARPVAAQIVGPAVGGGVVAVAGTGWAFALDAVTFAVCVSCLVRIGPLGGIGTADRIGPLDGIGRADRIGAADRIKTLDHSGAAVPAGPDRAIWRDLREGIDYVRRNVWLWGTFLAATFTYLLFVGPTEVLLPYLVKEVLHGSAGQLGLVLTSGGLGAVLAASVVGQLGVPRRYMTFIYLMWTMATLAVAGYGLARHSWQLGLACALVTGLEAAGTVAWATAKQRLVPAGMMGRVSSVDWFVSIALVPLSYALAAPAAHAFGVRPTLVLAGVLGAVATLAFLFLPGMRTADAPAPAGAGAGDPIVAAGGRHASTLSPG
jgi:Transmembrane secretion effector